MYHTSTATQHALPPLLHGQDHMQSGGLLLLQLLFLQRALQDRGLYSPSVRNLFNAVYQAGQLEKLSCNKALAATHEELLKMQKKVENIESVYKRSPDQGDGKEINLLQSMTKFLDAFSKDTGGLCNKDDALVTAVKLGDAFVTQLILDTDANVSTVSTKANPYQRTALHWAAAEGHRHVAEALLEYGANLEAKTTGGATPLHLAVRDNADKDVVRTLLKNGADIDARDNEGRTALHVAAQTGDLDLVQLLIEYGADPQSRYSKQHITPRKVAAIHGHKHLADWLKQFEKQHTDGKPSKQQRESMEEPLFRQLPFPERDIVFDEVPDKSHSEEPVATMSKAFLEDGKIPETHMSPQTTADGMFSNTTHLSDFGNSEDQEEFTDTLY